MSKSKQSKDIPYYKLTKQQRDIYAQGFAAGRIDGMAAGRERLQDELCDLLGVTQLLAARDERAEV